MSCRETMGEHFTWLWDGLPEDQAATLASTLRAENLDEGARLFDALEESTAMWFVTQGEIEVAMDTPSGALVLGRIEAGGLIGETDLLAPLATPVRATATKASTLCRLDRDGYGALREEAPIAAGRLVSAISCEIARRIREASVGRKPTHEGERLEYQPGLRALHGLERQFVPVELIPMAASTPSRAPDHATLLKALEHSGVYDRARTESDDLAAGLRADLEALAPSLGYHEHPAGAALVEAGRRADGVFIVLEGEVRVSVDEPGSWFHVDQRLGPGESFGHIAFFDDGTRSASIRTTQPTKLAVIYPQAVKDLLVYGEAGARTPLHTMEWFARQLVRDARRLNASILEAMSQTA